MNLHWAGSMAGMEALAHLPVWLASYGPVPALDRGVTLWQYSESGVVDGVEGPVDLTCGSPRNSAPQLPREKDDLHAPPPKKINDQGGPLWAFYQNLHIGYAL